MLSIHKILKNNLRKNEKGGIEGLPLQLMIIILVATIGTAIIIGWMGNIETPHTIGEIQCDDNIIIDSNGIMKGKFSVSVTDQDGNPLEGATVVMSGLGVNNNGNKAVYQVTDENGIVTFSGLKMNLSSPSGTLNIDVSSPEYGDRQCKVIVLKD